MAQTTPTVADYRRRLDAAVTALSLFIHDLCPEPRLGISLARCGDEDAHTWVSLPSILAIEEREQLANRMAEKELGYFAGGGLSHCSRHRGIVAEPFHIARGVKPYDETWVRGRSRARSCNQA